MYLCFPLLILFSFVVVVLFFLLLLFLLVMIAIVVTCKLIAVVVAYRLAAFVVTCRLVAAVAVRGRSFCGRQQLPSAGRCLVKHQYFGVTSSRRLCLPAYLLLPLCAVADTRLVDGG